MQKLKSIYKSKQEFNNLNSRYPRQGKYVMPHKLKNYSTVYSSFSGDCKVQIDNEGSLYILIPMQATTRSKMNNGGFITKFAKTGKIAFKTNLKITGVQC